MQSLADSCFPVSNGPISGRLHGIFFHYKCYLFTQLHIFPPVILLSDVAESIEFFLRQFCDAHTCTRGPKPFSKGHKVEFSVLLKFSNFLFLIHAHTHLCKWTINHKVQPACIYFYRKSFYDYRGYMCHCLSAHIVSDHPVWYVQKRASILYISISILTLMLLTLFCFFVYLYQR